MTKSLTFQRIVALIIDLSIIGIISKTLEEVFSFMIIEKTGSLWGIPSSYQLSLGFVGFLCYFLIFAIFSRGRTAGKLVFRLKVIGRDGKPQSVKILVVRVFLKLISVSLWPISAIVFLFGKSVTFHDAMMRTKVVEVRNLKSTQQNASY